MKTIGLILAGGLSKRMGQCKSELLYQSKSLLQKQYETLASLPQIDSVLVSGNQKDYISIPDQVLGQGPLEGIRCVATYVLENYGPQKLLVLPVDMPLLDRDILTPLLKLPAKASGVKYLGFELPVLLKCDCNLLHKLTNLKCLNMPYSFKSLYSMLLIHEIQALHSHNFSNLNTPQDWKEFLNHEH
ncbi:MAG: NTP transferase domain-containing protein [Candidatus Cloacimonetes bacterium]|nr:NTP transferase domain-containing protein [Candidatus Cloacimonadota bacterium]